MNAARAGAGGGPPRRASAGRRPTEQPVRVEGPLGHRPTGAVSGNVIPILPPLILTREDGDRALPILGAAIEHAQAGTEPREPSGTGWMG